MLERYRALVAKIDGFFDRVAARHGAEMRCAAGCSACCHQRLTVTTVEAAALEEWAAALPAARRSAIAAAAEAADAGRCSALDDDGRCRIYDARPLVCRSHGVPVRMTSPRGLPVIQSCELNFTTHGPAAADADCVLDQELVSTMLGLVNREYAADPTERIDLADLLRGLEGI